MNDFNIPLMIPVLATAYVLGIYLMLHFAKRYAAASPSRPQKVQ